MEKGTLVVYTGPRSLLLTFGETYKVDSVNNRLTDKNGIPQIKLELSSDLRVSVFREFLKTVEEFRMETINSIKNHK